MKALLDHDDPARTNYAYWPYLRQGLPIDFMTAQQRALVHDLLNTALSAKGYLGALQIWPASWHYRTAATISASRRTPACHGWAGWT